MIFRNFAKNMLGSKVKIKIIMYMLSENAQTSERELARILDVSHMAVNKSMKQLYDLNLVSPMKIGNVLSWKFNKNSYAYEHIAQNPLKGIADNPPLSDLKTIFSKKLTKKDLKEAIIFGSIAERKEEPDSDIDLLIITKNEKHKKQIKKTLAELSQICIQRYGNILIPYIITEAEAKTPQNKKIIKSAKSGFSVI